MVEYIKPIEELTLRECFDIAVNSSDSEKDLLIECSDWRVRRALAEYGNDEHREKLLKDETTEVRATIAQYGNSEHCEKLLDDPSEYVRATIARYGTDTQRERLLDDPSEDVRFFCCVPLHRCAARAVTRRSQRKSTRRSRPIRY